jgi:hypothetical protein
MPLNLAVVVCTISTAQRYDLVTALNVESTDMFYLFISNVDRASTFEILRPHKNEYRPFRFLYALLIEY